MTNETQGADGAESYVDWDNLNRLFAQMPSGPWDASRDTDGHEIRQIDTDPANKHHWPFRLCRSIPGQRAACDDAVFDFLAGALNAWPAIVEERRRLHETVERKQAAKRVLQAEVVELRAALAAPRAEGKGGTLPTDEMLHAAMDAFYPGEDWRNDLGCALETSLRDMRAALIAAQPAGQAGDAGAAARANLFEMLWRDAEDEAQRLEAGMKPSRDQIAEAFHEHRRERQPNLPQWSEVDQNSGAAKFAHAFVDRLLSIRPEEPSDAGWSQAARDVLAERRRQVSAEGWTPGHDDEHDKGEILAAALCYLSHRFHEDLWGKAPTAWPASWPWDRTSWKPTNRRRDLVKAGALILAEVERLDRATAPSDPAHSGQAEG